MIFCLNVLEHVNDPTGYLRFFREMLKDGGMLIITIHHKNRLRRLLDKYRHYHEHKQFKKTFNELKISYNMKKIEDTLLIFGKKEL